MSKLKGVAERCGLSSLSSSDSAAMMRLRLRAAMFASCPVRKAQRGGAAVCAGLPEQARALWLSGGAYSRQSPKRDAHCAVSGVFILKDFVRIARLF
jgi:hypothetical protein